MIYGFKNQNYDITVNKLWDFPGKYSKRMFIKIYNYDYCFIFYCYWFLLHLIEP